MQDSLLYFILRPRYWLQLLGLLFVKLIATLPLSLQIAIGRSLGHLMRRLVKRRRIIAEINLRLCFPERPQQQRDDLLKENFALTGLGIIESAVCWFGSLKSRLAKTTIIGRENLENAIAQNKGVILLSFHMTSLEMGGSLLCNDFDITPMYKPSKNRLTEYIMRSGRLRHVNTLLTQDDARGTIKALRKNAIVWYGTDQNYGNKASNFSPFFGIQASTITATSKFTKMTGAQVIPFTHKRSADGKSYELTLHPALDNFPGDSEQADATRINLFLENYLKENPEDYMWLHQRFRTRPAGEAPIYPLKKPKNTTNMSQS